MGRHVAPPRHMLFVQIFCKVLRIWIGQSVEYKMNKFIKSSIIKPEQSQQVCKISIKFLKAMLKFVGGIDITN